MIKQIKKLVLRYQRQRLAKHRQEHNREQLRQIYAGLIERGN